MPFAIARHVQVILMGAFLCSLVLIGPKRPVTGAQRPNILFCIADDASYPLMGAYGCNWVKTPGFDRVAREGLLFRRAYTPNAKCAPSRSCILTGRNSWQLKAGCNHIPYFPHEFMTYAESLSRHGYFVGKTAKGWAPGVANDADGRPRQMAGRPFEKRKLAPPAGGISSTDYAGNFSDFLEAVPSEDPWCFWYGCREPHRGYEFGSGIAKGGKSTRDIDRVPEFWPDTDTIRTDMLDYAFEVEHFDHHLVRMLEMLEAQGRLEDTLVVVTADNGMPFPRIKGQEYELSNHLPLAIRWGHGIKNPGRTIDDYVSFIDFAPTFLEVAGIEWSESGMASSPGRSLTDIFQSERSGQVNPARDHVLIGKERHDIGRPHDGGYPVRGIVKNGLLYLRNYEPTRWPAGNPETGYLNCDGSPTKTEILNLRRLGSQMQFWRLAFGKRPEEELFQVADDPECLTNLAENPKFAARKKALKKQMEEELSAQKDPRQFGQGNLFDEYPYADDGQRGFYEKYMSGARPRTGWVSRTDYEKRPLSDDGTKEVNR